MLDAMMYNPLKMAVRVQCTALSTPRFIPSLALRTAGEAELDALENLQTVCHSVVVVPKKTPGQHVRRSDNSIQISRELVSSHTVISDFFHDFLGRYIFYRPPQGFLTTGEC